MKNKLYILTLYLFLVLTFTVINAQSIYIWDNENNAFYFPDPETGELLDGSSALGNVLTELGFEYQRGFDLPPDPEEYDLIMAMMGSFCES